MTNVFYCPKCKKQTRHVGISSREFASLCGLPTPLAFAGGFCDLIGATKVYDALTGQGCWKCALCGSASSRKANGNVIHFESKCLLGSRHGRGTPDICFSCCQILIETRSKQFVRTGGAAHIQKKSDRKEFENGLAGSGGENRLQDLGQGRVRYFFDGVCDDRRDVLRTSVFRVLASRDRNEQRRS